MSQSGAKRDNSQYRVRLPKSVRFPIADALKHEASANTISHRDKIEAVAVRCALRQASVAKMSVDLDDLTPHATSDRAQLALLVGRGLFDGADAEVDNRLAHGSASRFEMSKVIFEKAGFVAITKLVFVRVFPHGAKRPMRQVFVDAQAGRHPRSNGMREELGTRDQGVESRQGQQRLPRASLRSRADRAVGGASAHRLTAYGSAPSSPRQGSSMQGTVWE